MSPLDYKEKRPIYAVFCPMGLYARDYGNNFHNQINCGIAIELNLNFSNLTKNYY